jgi:hypothetical protein
MTSKKKNVDYKAMAKTLSKNYWAISTVILALLLIGLLLSGGTGGPTVSAQEAGQKLLSFANNQGANAELTSVNDGGQFYEVILSIQGQEVPLYVTKDGKSFTQQLVPLDSAPSTPTQPSTPTPTSVPKSDKPIVEAFVMSHCPYGTQIEKGLLPVAELLGDKIDFQIKFVYYAMHPTSGEVEEQLNQYCIQEEQNDKFLNYLTCFLGKTGTPADGASCIDSVGIDKAKLSSCTTRTDEEFSIMANLNDQSSWLSGRFPLFNIHKVDNERYGVGGSPTLVINGAQASAGRDSVSLLNAICGAFNTAPEECSTQLEAGQPTPGFGFGTTAAANNAAAGCGV